MQQILEAQTVDVIKKAALDTLAATAKQALRLGEWPDFLPSLGKFAHSPHASQRELALKLLGLLMAYTGGPPPSLTLQSPHTKKKVSSQMNSDVLLSSDDPSCPSLKDFQSQNGSIDQASACHCRPVLQALTSNLKTAADSMASHHMKLMLDELHISVCRVLQSLKEGQSTYKTAVNATHRIANTISL